MSKPNPPTRRVNRGRYHSYKLDGEDAPGVTTILSKGIAKPGLVKWAAKTVAADAVDRWDELAQLGVAARLEQLVAAPDASRDGLGARGTEIHTYGQQLLAGQDVDVPDPILGHVDALIRFLADWQPREILVEATVGNRRRRYMGTLDLYCDIDGDHWLLDWKTSASGVYAEAALQLNAYANAEFFLDSEGNEQEMPHVDRAGAVWLREDGYDLYEAVLSDENFEMFLFAKQLANFSDWSYKERDRYLTEPVTPPARETTE